MSNKITYNLLPGQAKFVNSNKKQILYSGGFGSGKSRALCMAMLKNITIPNNVVLLIRKTLVSLKKSTLVSLIGGTDPILPPGSYSYNKSEGIIKVNGGGSIYLCGMEDPQRIRSFNLGAAFIDEVTEFSENEFKEISWRLRLDCGTRQLFCCGNPAGQNHFLYKHFFLENNIGREVITASSLENKYLPADYLDELKTMDGGLYKRYVEGQWITLDDAIYDSFDRNIHVKPISKKAAYEEYFIAIDFGYSNPTAILVCAKNGDRVYVLEEHYKKKMLLGDIGKLVLKLTETYPEPTIIYDPSAAALAGELENLGLKPQKANNDVNSGIDRVRNKLKVRNDSPDLIISDMCPNLIREMENYQFQTGTEKPLKVEDHGVDAIRYLCSHIDDITNEHKPVIVITGDQDEEEF